MEPNPVQTVLRRQIGIDAYGLDQDTEVLWESWLDRPRAKDAGKLVVRGD